MKSYLSFGLLLALIAAFSSEGSATKKPRVVGGYPASEGQYPFVGAVQVTTAIGKHFCGATLLSNEYMLTAAQCVYNATGATIQLGTVKLSGNSTSTVTVATSEFFVHPEYNPLTLENDIGLIKFREPVGYTSYISPVFDLPNNEIGDGWAYRFIGWGQLSDADGELAENLQEVDLVSLSLKECRQVYGDAITPNMMCAAGNNDEGACLGDTGSPLVILERFAMGVPHGIASFVSGNGCESPEPSGFTRVFPFVSWIREITGFTKPNF